MADRPTDPLAGQYGWLADMLDTLDDAGIEQYIRCWEFRRSELQAKGDGYGAWWCSKHISAGMAEQRDRHANRGRP